MNKLVLLSTAFIALSGLNTADARVMAVVDVDQTPQLCEGFGPQTPRDISMVEGTNTVKFDVSQSYKDMNLCNIHFHKQAEHKGPGFSIVPTDGTKGFQCNKTSTLTEAQMAPMTGAVCNGLKPGDTVEVHWVHTSCDVDPGPTLGACLSDACANPQLRVETQVFLLANDDTAINFGDLVTQSDAGYANAIPSNTGEPVVFAGSTTGPSFTEQTCSPLQVGWSVRPQCAMLDINTLGAWCNDNVYDEDHAHGVRDLVTSPALLSPIE